MWLQTVLLVAFVAIPFSHAYVGDENWDVVRGGQLERHLNSVHFDRHPIRNGAQVLAYPAYYSHNGYEAFGQTFADARGQLCARFPGSVKEIKPEPIIVCDGFRVLTNRDEFQEFFLVSPQDRDHVALDAEFVEFHDRAVVIYDEEENSSFFGTWTDKTGEPLVTGVDYNKRQVTFRGKSYLEDNVLYIARDK